MFASTVRFLRNNPAASASSLVGGWLVSLCYGGHSVEETPGSIPNPEAKLDCADGTALGRVWESRSPPDIFTGSGGVLEPFRGVRLLHSLLSCPKAPIWGAAHLRAEGVWRLPGGASSMTPTVMAAGEGIWKLVKAVTGEAVTGASAGTVRLGSGSRTL